MFADYLDGRAGIWAGSLYNGLRKASLFLLCGLLNSVDSILPDDNYYAI